MNNDLKVTWIRPRAAPDNEIVIEVDTIKLANALLSSHPDDYLRLGDSRAPTIENRYEQIGEAILAGKTIETPQFGIDNGLVVVADGRHRLAWCRDHGIRRISVLVDQEYAAEFLQLVG